jgi:hypothetical protein
MRHRRRPRPWYISVMLRAAPASEPRPCLARTAVRDSRLAFGQSRPQPRTLHAPNGRPCTSRVPNARGHWARGFVLQIRSPIRDAVHSTQQQDRLPNARGHRARGFVLQIRSPIRDACIRRNNKIVSGTGGCESRPPPCGNFPQKNFAIVGVPSVSVCYIRARQRRKRYNPSRGDIAAPLS